MEVIDLGALDDLDPISLDIEGSGTGFSSSNFGSGIELLMNDKKISSGNSNLNLGELDNLESELNELSGHSRPASSNGTKTLSGMAANLFGFGSKEEPESKPMPSDEPSSSNIGQATRSSMGNAKTWDGFSKINEIPLNAEKATTLSEREVRRKKRAMLKKLDEWYEKGLIKHNSNFSLD